MISLPTIVRAAVRRFIPGVLGFLGCTLYFSARIESITLGPAQIVGFTNLVVLMTLGFSTTLLAMRQRLTRGTRVDGWRSVAAGFGAPAILLALEMLHGSPVSHSLNYTFAFIAGGVASLAPFIRRIDLRSALRRHGFAVRAEVANDSDGLLSRRAARLQMIA